MTREMTQDEAEAIAQRHVELARSVAAWFGLARRKEVTWGPDYNQSARDLYVKACKLCGAVPHSAE